MHEQLEALTTIGLQDKNDERLPEYHVMSTHYLFVDDILHRNKLIIQLMKSIVAVYLLRWHLGVILL
jgi:hypothetical protein